MTKQIDFAAVQERAANMSFEQLHYAMVDCARTALSLDTCDQADSTNTAGYYRDECSVYRTEMMRRA